MFKIDLSNKTVAITGASQGIGKAISEVFLENGAKVILLSRNESKLANNVNELNVRAGLVPAQKSAQYYVLDVSKPDDVESIFKQIGSVDILINNAGVYFTSDVQNMNENKWQELLDINLSGAMYCTKNVLGGMKKNKWGRIINISSVSGKSGDKYGSAYCASKFGLIGFTQSLAQEVARENITANCICPGWTKTKMAKDIVHDEKYARLTGMPLEKLEEYSIEAVPIGRYVQPSEVAHLALYLASDYASAITGQSINICGGICMH